MDIGREARLALAAKGAAEHDLARLTVCPPWRHAAFAVIMAALVATPVLPLLGRFMLLTVVMLAVAVLVQSDRRRLGVFINGYRRGRTRLVAFPLLVIELGIYAISNYVGLFAERPLVSIAMAGIAGVVGYVGSVLWQRVFVRELTA